MTDKERLAKIETSLRHWEDVISIEQKLNDNFAFWVSEEDVAWLLDSIYGLDIRLDVQGKKIESLQSSRDKWRGLAKRVIFQIPNRSELETKIIELEEKENE